MAKKSRKSMSLFAISLIECRKDSGESLREMEKLTGISNATLSQLEHEVRPPSVSTLATIATHFRWSKVLLADMVLDLADRWG